LCVLNLVRLCVSVCGAPHPHQWCGTTQCFNTSAMVAFTGAMVSVVSALDQRRPISSGFAAARPSAWHQVCDPSLLFSSKDVCGCLSRVVCVCVWRVCVCVPVPVRACVRACVSMLIFASTWLDVCMHSRACVRACAHTPMHACVRACKYTCGCAFMFVCVRACLHGMHACPARACACTAPCTGESLRLPG
jgi:hypothetical protein